MYNFAFYILELGVYIASLFSDKVRKMWRGERESFAKLKACVEPGVEYAWFHAASLGEFEQGRPIMEEYRKLYPSRKILLTFFSPSGYEVRKNYDGADIICYLPLDTPTNAKRFLDLITPVEAFIIKYEFWYNYFHILRERNVPVYSVSSIFRDGQIFFKKWSKPYSKVLNCVSHFFVQNEKSRQLLATKGLTNVTVTGDTRFDRVVQIAKQSKSINEVKWFKQDKNVFVAGSSWQPDEEIFIPYFNDKKDWKLIIAPHVISESHISQIMQLLSGRNVVRMTEIRKEMDNINPASNEELITVVDKLRSADVMIIDCFGLLSSIYKYGEVAYVGGGFGVGIHNLPEAAVWSVPVLFGPNNGKFQEAQGLKMCGGGIEINSADIFKSVMDEFIGNNEALRKASESAGNYVRSHSGATEKLLEFIKKANQ